MTARAGLLVAFEWFATVILIFGVVLSAYDVYPLYLYVNLFADTLWGVVAVLWGKSSLLFMQLVLTLMYVAGIYHYLTS